MTTLANIPIFDPGMSVFSMGEAAPKDPDDIKLTDNPSHLTRAGRRRHAELTRRASAVEQIKALPRSGEVLHLRMDGSYNGVELVEALVELSGGKVTDLTIATLSYNRRVAERLLELLDQGRVERCTVLVSSMMEGKDRSTIDWLSDELQRRGGKQLIARNHQKLILIAAGRRRIVAEGSQNLRTCRCWEQVSVTSSASLYRWHADFITRIERGEVG